MLRKTGKSWVVVEESRQYHIKDMEQVCAAVIDTGSCNNVSLVLHNGATISIDFETKANAEKFFEEVGYEIDRNQKDLVKRASGAERKASKILAM